MEMAPTPILTGYLIPHKKPNKLSITEEVFNRLYPDLVGKYDHFNDPVPAGTSDKDFERLYLKSKLWRLNNLYKIVDKSGNARQFKMNYAQHCVYAATRQHPRIIILKSRQQGISTFFLVSYFDDALFCPFLNIGLMAQGTAEATTLLERSKFLWDNFDPQIKQAMNIRLKKDNTKELAFSNNSTVFIRVSFRSTTLQRLHISEFGKIANENPARAKETKTGTLQALGRGNTGAIESTAEGTNLFKTMWDQAVLAESAGELSEKDFKPVFLPWIDDPDCVEKVDQVIDAKAEEYFAKLFKETGRELTREQKNFWIVQRRELGDDIFQEYPATPTEAFSASRDGTYYSRLFNEYVVKLGRLVTGLYDENLPVEVYFDLGVDDYFVLAFVQYYEGDFRIIGEYWNNGYDLEHYIDHVLDSPYEVTGLVFPHDIQVRELGGGSAAGKARTRLDKVKEMLRDKGYSHLNIRVLAKSSVAEGIEMVKQMLKTLYMETKCHYLQACCLNYTKEWDDKQMVWKKTPLHNEFSHGADVLRQIAIGVQKGLGRIKGARKHRQQNGHDV